MNRESATKQFDVTAFGEMIVDLTEAGVSEAGRRLFEQNAGGAPANFASAVARFGGRVAFIGKVGNDMHGRFMKATLREVGVDTTGIVWTDDAFTTLAFVALEDGEREFAFARKPGADTCLEEHEVNFGMIERSRIFHFGSLSQTDEPARSATMAAAAHAKSSGVVVSYDPNYRATLWENEAAAARQMRSVLPYVDVIKVAEEEIPLLTDCKTPQEAARALYDGGIKLVAVTLGKKGALVCAQGNFAEVPGLDIPAVDSTGAGDSFWGGFVYSLLKSGKRPEAVDIEEAARFARFANAAATLCVTRRGGIPAMPSLQEVEALLEREGQTAESAMA